MEGPIPLAGGDEAMPPDSEEDEGAPAGAPAPVSAMAQLLGEQYAAGAADIPIETEVCTFLREPSAGLNCDPTDWWKLNERRFPRLAKLARTYLCIPATSVPSERVFSAAGLTVTRLRSSLTPEHVNMIIFLNKNQ